MTENTSTDIAKTVNVVYAGQRKLSGSKLGHWYANEDGTDFGGFDKPLAGTRTIGVLIELDVTTEGKYRTGSARAIGRADLPVELLAGWQLADDLIATEKAQASMLRRIEREAGEPLDDLIEPLRQALDKLNWSQRAAATAIIISRLR